MLSLLWLQNPVSSTFKIPLILWYGDIDDGNHDWIVGQSPNMNRTTVWGVHSSHIVTHTFAWTVRRSSKSRSVGRSTSMRLMSRATITNYMPRFLVWLREKLNRQDCREYGYVAIEYLPLPHKYETPGFRRILWVVSCSAAKNTQSLNRTTGWYSRMKRMHAEDQRTDDNNFDNRCAPHNSKRVIVKVFFGATFDFDAKWWTWTLSFSSIECLYCTMPRHTLLLKRRKAREFGLVN